MARDWTVDVGQPSNSYCLSGRKRCLDLALCVPVLALFALTLVPVGLNIALMGTGSVFYRQERVGRQGALFWIIKYRTMVEDAEPSGPQLSPGVDDPRITRAGRVLRRFHIDELPQVFNVLSGRMSFVGPRPERPHFHDQFTREVPGWVDRLAMTPGVTGLAQVRGHDAFSPEAKLKSDAEYALAASARLDILIVVRTFLSNLGGGKP